MKWGEFSTGSGAIRINIDSVVAVVVGYNYIRIYVGTGFNYFEVALSEEDNIMKWLDENNGAGDV